MTAPDSLSRRETEVLGYLYGPMGIKQIAGSMGISIRTANTYIMEVYRKNGTSGRIELMAKKIQELTV